MTNDNPASRLLSLLEKAKKMDPNMNCSTAWDVLLETNKDPSKLLSRMGKMISLPEQITSILANNSTSVSPEFLNHIAQQLKSAFTSQKTNDKWSEFINRIDIHLINYLGLASTLLETQVKTKSLTRDELEKLRHDFSNLIEEVRKSEISSRLKSYIVQQLYSILLAIDDYFITGAEPIINKIESTVGHALSDEEYKNFLKNEELGKTLFDCLSAAANLVTVAVGIPQLTQIITLIAHQ